MGASSRHMDAHPEYDDVGVGGRVSSQRHANDIEASSSRAVFLVVRTARVDLR